MKDFKQGLATPFWKDNTVYGNTEPESFWETVDDFFGVLCAD